MKPKYHQANVGTFNKRPVPEEYMCDHCHHFILPGDFIYIHNETKLDFCSIKCAVDELNERDRKNNSSSRQPTR